MLHILCLMIKWIGIVLVFLLALILLAVALVLFCPVRYRAKIKKTVEEWGAQGRVTWLFGLIRLTVKGGSEGMDVDIRIFGMRLSFLKKLFSRKKMQSSLPVTKDISHEEESALEIVEQPEGEKKLPVSDTKQAEKKEEQKEEQEEEHVQRKEGLLKRLWMKIVDICRGIKMAFLRFVAMIRNIRDKTNLCRTFLRDPHTGAAFSMVWQQIFGLLRHAGLQKWEGSVDLGLGDPSATGQLLAVLAATYPIYGGHISVDPIWDKKILEGEAYVKGRVYGIKVLCMAGRIYFNRDVKYVINWFRQNGGNYVTGKQ